MGVAVGVEMIPDQWVVVQDLLFWRYLDHVSQVGLLLDGVVERRHVPVDADVTVVLVGPAELVQLPRYVA